MEYSDYEYAMLLGLLLGDGTLTDRNSFEVTHSVKQEEYCKFKANILSSIINCPIKTINLQIPYKSRGGERKHSEAIRFKKASKDFEVLRKMLYPNNKKYFGVDVLNKLNKQALAFWWLDDGNIDIHKSGNGYYCACLRWSTFCSKEEADIIVDYFKTKWNVTWKSKISDKRSPDKYNLFCGKKEGSKFLNLIRDYVEYNIPSMKYKVIDLDTECSKLNTIAKQ